MELSYKIALKQIIDLLNQLEKDKVIEYYLVGGILVNIYSDFRITRDIDLVIDFQASNFRIEDYIIVLKKNDFFPFQDWNTTKVLARETKLIQFLDKTETVKYDNHIIDKFNKSKYKKIGSISLKRRVKETLFGVECWVASKEDFILSKLIHGGWQDYSDALGCWMRFNQALDVQYMSIISKELGIQKEFNLLKSGIDDPDDYFKQINGY
ncbi:MAG: hypothetical protein ACTSV5_09090 [Promethearchaeota archaeon]